MSTAQVLLAGAATTIIFVMTKDKRVFVGTNMCLSRQNTSFVATKVMFITTKLLSPQNYVCHDKTFVATKLCVTEWPGSFTCLSRQNFHHQKNDTCIIFSWKQTCFVATKLLSRQNYVCREQNFVATKMILVAGPANDAQGHHRTIKILTNYVANPFSRHLTKVNPYTQVQNETFTTARQQLGPSDFVCDCSTQLLKEQVVEYIRCLTLSFNVFFSDTVFVTVPHSCWNSN